MRGWLGIDEGDAPLIVSIPHAGTQIPDAIADDLAAPDRARCDADFHVDKLYGFARELGATVLCTEISRTVIDLNRNPGGASLYPGQITTGLCPTECFDGTPLYRPGREPDHAEIDRRRALWFDPYHVALGQQIARLRAIHPAIIVYDAHSIRSRVPRLFPGTLPQFNIGTNGGKSCAARLAQGVGAICARSPDVSWVIDGRFRGGWITRHYGNPAAGVHAIQMELAMRTYLDEYNCWPPIWNPQFAEKAQKILRLILNFALTFAKEIA